MQKHPLEGEIELCLVGGYQFRLAVKGLEFSIGFLKLEIKLRILLLELFQPSVEVFMRRM